MKFFVYSITVFIVISTTLFAPETAHTLDTSTFLQLGSITNAGAPKIYDDFIIFTYEQKRYARYVAAAFAHEGYGTLHLYSIRKREDNTNLFYLIYPLSSELQHVEYRIVIDGIWISDPHADETTVDKNGITVSHVKLNTSSIYRYISPRVHKSGMVTFSLSNDIGILSNIQTVEKHHVTLHDIAQARVSLVGNFNAWDNFIHTLSPDKNNDGIFSTSIFLKPGTYYYYFMVDGTRILDPFHNNHARDPQNGTYVSVLTIP